MGKMMERLSDRATDKFASKIDEQMERLEKRFDLKLKAALDSLSNRLTALETKYAGLKTSPPERGHSAPLAPFVPSFVDLKGWCEWEEPLQKGITRAEGKAMIAKLLDITPKDIRKHISEPEFRG